jgi:hypothetical protein
MGETWTDEGAELAMAQGKEVCRKANDLIMANETGAGICSGRDTMMVQSRTRGVTSVDNGCQFNRSENWSREASCS